MNMLTLYDNLEIAKKERSWQVEKHGHLSADDCLRCGKCEQACPQRIKIREELARSVEVFGPAR